MIEFFRKHIISYPKIATLYCPFNVVQRGKLEMWPKKCQAIQDCPNLFYLQLLVLQSHVQFTNLDDQNQVNSVPCLHRWMKALNNI